MDLDETITIGTHNVRGITHNIDQTNLMEEIKKQKIDILGLSETKLTCDNEQWAFKDQNEYKYFSSVNSDRPYGAGVALLIKKE